MRVYNLTQSDIDFRGKKIPANGGSTEYGDFSFLPNRDRKLEEMKVLSFGKLPRWWKPVVHSDPVARAAPVKKEEKKEEVKVIKLEEKELQPVGLEDRKTEFKKR